ncbi:hypothetical protein OHA18_37870 [Kribbella sp. NBC_00709]|uniref:hypothetical protein n=1 Tax=Kribbella sp. NBC_00709 TaxID=2975972 RepID=UPI002E2AA667|nr:hypothetical protein [Kribbella sp. NBC_00709]
MVAVNWCTLGELILFRTASDSAVAQYDLDPIAFELDVVDEGMHDGWSVLVDGMSRAWASRTSSAMVRRRSGCRRRCRDGPAVGAGGNGPGKGPDEGGTVVPGG